MSLGMAFAAIIVIAAAVGWLSYSRARRFRAVARLHSLPTYHGAYAALWAAIPALLLIAAWSPIQSRLVDRAVLSSPEGKALPSFQMQRESILSEAREIASGEREQGFNPESGALAPRIRSETERFALIGGSAAMFVALAAGLLASRRTAPQYRARRGLKRWMLILLLAA